MKRCFSQVQARLEKLQPPKVPVNFSCHLRAFDNVHETYSIDEVKYSSSTGGLLEVQQVIFSYSAVFELFLQRKSYKKQFGLLILYIFKDMEALKQLGPEEWKNLFDSRMGGPTYYGSGKNLKIHGLKRTLAQKKSEK